MKTYWFLVSNPRAARANRARASAPLAPKATPTAESPIGTGAAALARRLARLWLGLLLALAPSAAQAQTPTADSFNPGADSDVYSLAVQADGKILVGGAFTTLGGQPCKQIGRLNADGTLDGGFNPGAVGSAFSLAVQADGKILVGGDFTALGGQPRNHIGRLNADGTLDGGFNPGAGTSGDNVSSLAVQADGKILVGGYFTTLCGQPRNFIGRLNADGTLDSGFNPGAWGAVSSLAVQADGKILVGGYISSLGGQPRNYIGRLNADGTLDGGFNPGADGAVHSLAVQADGKILVGGDFTTLGGQPQNYIGRLNADGTLDSGFNPGATGANSQVMSLAIQSDGKILVGGYFSTLGGQPRSGIGRLNNTEPAMQDLAYAGSTITWLRGGTSPEVWRTTFEHSPNGVTWTSLGAGARVPGGWQLTGVSLPPSGTIRARGHVTGGYNNSSAWFIEAYFGAPILISQPTSRTNDAGTTATFSVVAGGTELLSYQWRFYGTNLAGQTSASLVLTGITTNQAGPYTVVVTNASGSVTSAAATLTVVPSLGEALDNPNLTWTTRGNAPWFAQTSVTHDGVDAAQSGNIGASGESYLEATVNGPGTLTFWWRWDSQMFFDFLIFYIDNQSRAVPSQSSTWELQSFTISGGVHHLMWYYEKLLDEPGMTGPAWVDQVSFVPEGQSAPAIIVQPQSRTNNAGTTATFSVSATGTAPLSYCWQRNGIPVADRIDVIGAHDYLLMLVSVQAADAGDYRVVVTNAYGSVTSQVATLTVTVPQVPPAITLQPQSRTNLVGTTATFSVAAVGTEPLAYQWRFNGTDLSGATATALTFPNVQTSDAGDYAVVITNAYGSVTSQVATLTVTNCVEPTMITVPMPFSKHVGESLSISFIAAGTEPLSYQWRLNGTELPGATSTNLTLMNIQPADAGDYGVCVTNACGSVTGTVAYLSVTQPGVPASITAQPQSRTNVAGTTATFTVTATGTAPLRYQWLKNSTRLVNTGNISGATTANLTLTDVQLVDAGDYQVIVTNAFGAVTSVVAMLAVTGCVPPTITTPPASLTRCAGEPATFSVTAAGTSLTYQWRKDGAVLSGATKSNYSLAAVAAGDAGSYDCLVSNACGAAGMSQNLAQNPGFEEGTSGWFALGAGSLTATTSRAHSGSRSAYVQGRTDTWNGVAQSLLGVVQPSATHLIGVWVWVEGGANQPVNLTIKQSDGGGTTYRNVASATVAPGQWKQLVGGFTLTVSGTLTELTLYAEGPAAGVSFYADDFVVQPLVGSSQNLAQNPGFEQGTTGWSALGANLLTATASPVHSGSKSAYVQGRTDTWNGLQQALLGVVQPSIVYRNGAWVRLDGAGDQPVRLKFTQTDSAGTTWPEIASGTANSTTWTHLIGEFALNAYGTLTELNLYIEGPAAGVNFYADDFVVEPLVATTEGPAPAATLTVNSPPTITAQPAGVTRNNGDAVTFSVTASGAGLTYQWRKGGTNITGATGSNYTITAVAAGDAGSYDCVVSGACGLPVTSQAATLAVNSPPSITGQPSGATKNLGHSVTFSVAATGTG